MRRKIIFTVSVVALIFGLLLVPGAILHISQAQIAERHQYVAQAICDFRAQNGLLPVDLQELVPTYLPTVPTDSDVFYSDGTLSIHSELPHTGVSRAIALPSREILRRPLVGDK